jgi:hypothetical protein
MRFGRYPRPATHERTPRRLAAARRAVQRDRDSCPLFPDLVKHQTAEERLDAKDDEGEAYWAKMRKHQADTWRRARRELRALPSITRLGVLRYWNGERHGPCDASYLADLLWQLRRGRLNPWAELRAKRQLDLIQQGRLPRSALSRLWRGKRFNPYREARIRERIAERTSLRGPALYSIVIP